MPDDRFLFVNKTLNSNSLSQSEGRERLSLYRHVQPATKSLSGVTRKRQKKLVSVQKDDNEQSVSTRLCFSDTIVNPQLYDELDGASVLRYQLFGLFVDANDRLLQRQSDLKDVQSFSWLSWLPNLNENSDAGLHHSIAALSFAAVGREKKDDRLVRASAIEYGHALRAIQKRLSAEDSTLAACLTLIMYQFFSPQTGQLDWHAHIEGIAKIIQMREPHHFKDGLAHVLFTCSRSSIISAALNRRRGTFLSCERWMTTPWEDRQKSDYDRMIDCLARLSVVAESFDTVNEARNPFHPQQERQEQQEQQEIALLGQLWSTNFRFLQWFRNVCDVARPQATEATTLPTFEADDLCQHPFPTSHKFVSLAKANMFRMFCASLVDIYNMLALTYEALATQETPGVPHKPYLQRCTICSDARLVSHSGIYFCNAGAFPIKTELHFPAVTAQKKPAEVVSALGQACRDFAMLLADEICRSFQYCVVDDHGLIGRYLSVASLKFAIWCYLINLPTTARRLEWSRIAIKFLSDTGISFSANLLNERPYISYRLPTKS